MYTTVRGDDEEQPAARLAAASHASEKIVRREYLNVPSFPVDSPLQWRRVLRPLEPINVAEPMSEKQGTNSKIFVVVVGVFVLLFSTLWLAIYYFEAPGYDPEVAQEYVQHFNRRCNRDLQNQDLCREVIGHHHRSCFEAHLTRENPGDETSPYVYDRDRYMACMWQAAGR
jgi:hypothetical protein